MKFKATKKAIKENYLKIVGIGYCNAQYLLQYEPEIAYSAGQNGWACDYYDVDNVLISTGYAPIESRNVRCTYDIVSKYEDLARANVLSNLPWEEKKENNKDLLKQFIAEITTW